MKPYGLLILLSTINQMCVAMSAPTPVPVNTDIKHEIATTEPTPLIDFSITQQAWQMRSDLLLWQGFDHEWLRYIVAPKDGRIPHRISSLANYVSYSAIDGKPLMTFAQDTGVDGNYMHPGGRAVSLPGVTHAQGVVSMSWQDQLVDQDAVPQARNQLLYDIQLPASFQNGQLALQGLDLDLECVDTDQPDGEPCNSDGMWPYLLALQIGDCALRQQGYICPLKVNIYRGWTPNQGGVPGLGETKPLNQQLRYQLNIHVAAFDADESLLFSPVHSVQQSADLLAYDIQPNRLELVGQPGMNQAIPLLKGFGWMLTRPDSVGAQWAGFNSDIRQRGRYLAKLQFEMTDLEYQPEKGEMALTPAMQVWAPETVVDSRVHTFMDVQLLQSPQGSDRQSYSADGRLCLNSKDEAPFYSLWRNCNRQTPAALEKFGGRERARDSVAVAIE